MDKPVELIPLVCIQCSTPVPAQPDEVAWVCSQCGQGLALDYEKGLKSLEIHYASGIAPNTKGHPFWVADGQVSVQRMTYSGNQDRESQSFWGQPHRFFIPAYTCPIETVIQQGIRFLAGPPELQAGPAQAFEPVTLSGEDMKALAEFVVMAVEAGRKDKLKELHFNLTLDPPSLWVLP